MKDGTGLNLSSEFEAVGKGMGKDIAGRKNVLP